MASGRGLDIEPIGEKDSSLELRDVLLILNQQKLHCHPALTSCVHVICHTPRMSTFSSMLSRVQSWGERSDEANVQPIRRLWRATPERPGRGLDP